MTSTDQPLGEVLHDGDRIGLRYVRRLAHPPAKVWRALTESENLRQWMPVDIVGERRAGADVDVPFWPDVAAKYEIEDTVLPGRILAWEPERVFEWRWDTDILRFELEPTGDGTTLTFVAWLIGDQPEGTEGTAAGYHVCLAQLTALLDTGSAPPFVDADPGPIQALYREASQTT